MSGLTALLVFALTHLLVDRLTFLRAMPRSRILSFAGGVSVAYVFLHVFVELAESYQRVNEYDVFLVSLIGLSLFYGLELLARALDERQEGGRRVAAVHIAVFALYSVLFGFLLPEQAERGPIQYAFFTIAIALHFLTSDFGLWQSYPRLFSRYAKFIFAAALACGFALGLFTAPPRWLVEGIFAFLAGGIVLNVMKEELPEERQSRFTAFAAGVMVLVVLDFAGQVQ